jgi:hypothetical protein
MLFSSNFHGFCARGSRIKRDVAGKLFTVALGSACFCFSSVVGSKLFQSTKHCKIKINLSAIEFNKASADLIAERKKIASHAACCQKLGRSF